MDITLSEIANIIDDSKGKGYFSSQLESSLKPMFKKLESIGKDSSKFSMASFIGLSESDSKKFSEKMGKSLDGMASGMSSLFGGDRAKVLDKIKKNGAKSDVAGAKNIFKKQYDNTSNGGFSLEKDKIIKVRLEEVEPHLADRLFPPKRYWDSQKYKDAEENSLKRAKRDSGGDGGDGGGGVVSKLMGLLGGGAKVIGMGLLGIAALTAGSVALFKGLTDDGPMKGTMKVIGTTMVGFGKKLIDDVLGAFGKVFKNGFVKKHVLPKLEAGAFKSGKMAGVMLGGLKNIGGMFGTLIKGMFTKILEHPKVLIEKIVPSIVTRGASKGFKIGKFFAKIGKKMFGGLLKLGSTVAGKGAKIAFKGIPYLGSIISLAFAFSRFKKGDVVGGLLELTSALLGLIPIPGLAMIPDLFLMFRDLTMSKDERKKQKPPKFMQGIINWFKNLPIVRAISDVWTGFGYIFGGKNKGDMDKGIDLILRNGAIFRVLFPTIGIVFDILMWVIGGGMSDFASSVGNSIMSFGGWIWEYISKAFKGAWEWIVNFVGRITESNHFKLFKNAMSLGFSSLWTSILSAVDSVLQWLSDKIHNSFAGGIARSMGLKRHTKLNSLKNAEANKNKLIQERISLMNSEKERKAKDQRETAEREAQKIRDEKANESLKDGKKANELLEAVVGAVNGVTSAVVGTSNNGSDTSVFNFITGSNEGKSDTFRDKMFREIYG